MAAGVEGRKAWALGAFWAGLMWTRPDGIVHVALMAAAAVAFAAGARRRQLASVTRAGVVCGALYLPWLVFAVLYYGTPLPLSVIAKSATPGGFSVPDLAAKLRLLPQVLPLVFLPPFAQNGGWSAFASPAGVLAAVGLLYWLYPAGDRAARRASFVGCGGLLYLAAVRGYFPWYFPVIFLCALPAWKAILDQVDAGWPSVRWLVRGASAAVLAGLAFIWVDYAGLARATTEVNEEANRRLVGEWLREHAEPGDRVFLECPGYIGFYSGLKMLDALGLVAPEVVVFHRTHGGGMAAAGFALAPEWLVLRPPEVGAFQRYDAERLAREYQPVQVFDRRAELAARLPGHPAALYDSTFVVMRRVDAQGSRARPACRGALTLGDRPTCRHPSSGSAWRWWPRCACCRTAGRCGRPCRSMPASSRSATSPRTPSSTWR